jgi:hypothetical protein
MSLVMAVAKKARRRAGALFAPVPRRRLAARVDELARLLGPRVPDIDPGDLWLINESLLRPIGRSGRLFLLRDDGRGGYVF